MPFFSLGSYKVLTLKQTLTPFQCMKMVSEGRLYLENSYSSVVLSMEEVSDHLESNRNAGRWVYACKALICLDGKVKEHLLMP